MRRRAARSASWSTRTKDGCRVASVLRRPDGTPARSSGLQIVPDRRDEAGAHRPGGGSLRSRAIYSTSLPATETSRMSAAISSGIGGISSRVTPVAGDHTRFTCSDGVEFGVVAAVVASAGLASFERRLQGGASGERGRLEVEGVRQVLVAGDVGVHADVADAGLDRVELGEPGEEAVFVAHDAGVLGHGVADGALQGAHVLRAIRREQLGDLVARSLHRGCGALLCRRATRSRSPRPAPRCVRRRAAR